MKDKVSTAFIALILINVGVQLIQPADDGWAIIAMQSLFLGLQIYGRLELARLRIAVLESRLRVARNDRQAR